MRVPPYVFSPSKKPKLKSNTQIAKFHYSPPTLIKPSNNWGDWLSNQPSPVSKPNNKLIPLTTYLYGARQEYTLSLELTERWGYALNVGYGRDYVATISDAGNTTPTTNDGKLLRKAILEPNKYPVAGVVIQSYPASGQVPEGYIRDSNGAVIVNDWSPEATPAAMQTAVTYRMRALVALKATGVNIPVVYDGGETGLQVPSGKEASYSRDPRIVAGRGALTWADYISKRKGEQCKLFTDAVAALLPNRKVYAFYSALAEPYANVPDSYLSAWNYTYMRSACDLPTGSVYYKDFFASVAGMTNPAIRDRAYYDQLTHFLSAVADQIQTYNQPLSYNFVSAGYKHESRTYSDGITINPKYATEIAGAPNPYFMSIDAYRGFLKCMYACGMIGGVAGYFSDDVAFGETTYTTFNSNNPPHWLLQQQALADIHARFSWLEEYLYDGDLLQGDKSSIIKPALPSYEYTAYKVQAGFYLKQPDVRVFARKLKTANKWLVVLCVGEKLDGSAGNDTQVYVKSIPGLGTLELLARGIGSIYTVDTTRGNTIITQEDAT